jgi:hypothetical protein
MEKIVELMVVEVAVVVVNHQKHVVKMESVLVLVLPIALEKIVEMMVVKVAVVLVHHQNHVV